MGCPLSQRRKPHPVCQRFPYAQWNHPPPDGEFGVETTRGTGVAVSDLPCSQVFNGHPSSLVWDPDLNGFGTPIFLPRRCWMIFITSPLYNPPYHHEFLREPFIIESEKFGPFNGQMLMPDETAEELPESCSKKWTEHGREHPPCFLTPRIACRWCA